MIHAGTDIAPVFLSAREAGRQLPSLVHGLQGDEQKTYESPEEDAFEWL